MTDEPRHESTPPKPAKPRCKLIGRDSNVFNVIGLVRRRLIDAGRPDAASEFTDRATRAKSYDHVLQLVFEYVDPY